MPTSAFNSYLITTTSTPSWTDTITNSLKDISCTCDAASWVVKPTTDKPKKKTSKIPQIKQIYFNEKTGHTTIVWEDGSPSTVVRCGEGDEFERYLGFCAAVCKKLFGSTTAAKKLMDDKDADLAKKRKLEERQKAVAERRAIEAKNRERKEKREAAKLERLMKIVDRSMPNIDDILAKYFESDKNAD